MYVIGGDEAGKGEPWGPPVIAVVAYPKQYLEDLSFCKDSKRLTYQKLEESYNKLINLSYFKYSVVHHTVIDHNYYVKEMGYFKYFIHLYKKGLKDFQDLNIDAIIIDKFCDKFPDKRVTFEIKADTTYPICSAASIIARYHYLHIKQAYDAEYGKFLEPSVGNHFPLKMYPRDTYKKYAKTYFKNIEKYLESTH